VSAIGAQDWRVESLGRGVFLFRWQKGFYLSPFVVGDRGVTAFDPINAEAARAYRAAVRSVTDKPFLRLVYSHDHRDHACGGADLLTDEMSHCAVCAHARAAERIAARGQADVLAPNELLGDGAVLSDGAARIAVRYFGPNHSDSNLLFLFDTDAGTLLAWVDGVEPGVAPYRNLPDTDFAGYLRTLDAVAGLSFERVMGGHAGPDGRQWALDYRDYILCLLDSTAREFAASGGQVPNPGEDGVAMTERVRGEVTRAAAASLRARFGHWSGFEQWAPQTADRILSFLITGN
jgi:glyoxylase-like metal-dependent hydrolase (beta-lactamase superfamily II)